MSSYLIILSDDVIRVQFLLWMCFGLFVHLHVVFHYPLSSSSSSVTVMLLLCVALFFLPFLSLPSPTSTDADTGCASYIVVKGDTCDAIANSHRLLPSTFFALNPAIPKECTNLQIGQIVCVGCGSKYTVVKGDTCGTIANSHGLLLPTFFELNPTIPKECTNLQPGQIVCLAGTSPMSSISSNSTSIISIGTILSAIGTILTVIWRRRQDAVTRTSQPLAAHIYDHLPIVNAANFQEGDGIEFVKAVERLVEKLDERHGGVEHRVKRFLEQESPNCEPLAKAIANVAQANGNFSCMFPELPICFQNCLCCSFARGMTVRSFNAVSTHIVDNSDVRSACINYGAVSQSSQ